MGCEELLHDGSHLHCEYMTLNYFTFHAFSCFRRSCKEQWTTIRMTRAVADPSPPPRSSSAPTLLYFPSSCKVNHFSGLSNKSNKAHCVAELAEISHFKVVFDARQWPVSVVPATAKEARVTGSPDGRLHPALYPLLLLLSKLK